MKQKVHTIRLSDEEVCYLSNVLWHFTDYMYHDDRPDHGLAKLTWFRNDAPNDVKEVIAHVSGKINRTRIRNEIKVG